MFHSAANRTALMLSAFSLILLLDACVCRPLRVDMVDYKTPTTVAELKASLP